MSIMGVYLKYLASISDSVTSSCVGRYNCTSEGEITWVTVEPLFYVLKTNIRFMSMIL